MKSLFNVLYNECLKKVFGIGSAELTKKDKLKFKLYEYRRCD